MQYTWLQKLCGSVIGVLLVLPVEAQAIGGRVQPAEEATPAATETPIEAAQQAAPAATSEIANGRAAETHAASQAN